MTVRAIPYATRVHFGPGAVEQLGSVLAAERMTRPLVLCDAGVRAAGLEARVVDALAQVAHERRVLAGTDERALRDLAKEAKRLRCDGVVAVGGGSVIDAAKLVALCMASGRPLAAFAVDATPPERLPERMPAVVCVPTTAGTGSDVSRGAAVHADGRRLVLLGNALIPRVTVCDPLLTLALPASLTAATAVDALTHCIEGFLSPRGGPPFDAIALCGVRRIVEWLPKCLEKPNDVQARSELMMGALEGGISMPLGLGVMHGLAVPLDGAGVHHGTVVGILAPHVLNFYEHHSEPKLERLRELLHLRSRKGAVAHAITRLLMNSGLPLALSEAGVTPDLADAAVRFAPTSPYHASSPIQPTTLEYAQLMSEAM